MATTLLGAVAGSMRGIALSTCVTLLVPEDRRDKANGLIGTVTGVSFAITSVFSGLVVGRLGMGWALYGALALTAVALVHLRTIHVDEPEPVVLTAVPAMASTAASDASAPDASASGASAPAVDTGPHAAGGVAEGGGSPSRVDVRGAVEAIRAAPGLGALIAFAAFNNLLAGVFMALMDAYGLSLVSVETWGLLFGGLSLGFIVGGLLVARLGLGRSPVRVILLCNLATWACCSLFTVRSSIVLLTVGTLVWFVLLPVVEAAEQTVLQRSVPFERQGRVFGFAQMVENAAAPLTSIAIAPVAERVFMPTMTDGWGADVLGGWFGTGPERGLALLFTLAGVIGVIATLVVRTSRSYRLLADEQAEVDTEDVALAA